MDIRYLVAFQTILETGSFSKAANQLGYTQAAITFQIQQLEQELGIKLFERIGRNLQLTESGRQILPLAALPAQPAPERWCYLILGQLE